MVKPLLVVVAAVVALAPQAFALCPGGLGSPDKCTCTGPGPILKTSPINKDWFPGDKPVLTKIEDLGGVKVSTVGLQTDWFAKRPTDVKVWRRCRFGTGIGLLGQKKFPKYICNNCGPGYFELCNVNNGPSLLEVPFFFFRRGVKLDEACIEFSGVVDPAQPKSFVTNALLY